MAARSVRSGATRQRATAQVEDPWVASEGHPSLKDVAAGYIRGLIVSGDLPPGSKLAQDEIAEDLGISRLPVREALIELGEKGYVVTVPRRGVFVVQLAVDDILDHFEVVGLVFAVAARRAAAAIDDAQIQWLRDLHQAIASAESPNRMYELDREFVRVVNRVGSSARLRQILQSLAGAPPGAYYLAAPEWRTTETKYRKLMLAALAARDADRAAQVAQEHLQECGRLTVKVLDKRGYWSAAPSDESDR